MTAETAPSPTSTKRAGHERAREEVIIRPWPKVIFLYPTLVVALFCFFSTLTIEGKPEGQTWISAGALGFLFMATFFVNLLVFSFEFGRIKSITIALLVIAVILGALYIDSQKPFLPDFMAVLRANVNIRANAQFYGYFSALLVLILVFVLINTRFNYFVVKRNEILHRVGYLGDVERFPSPNLRMTKEIPDIFEYLLLRSGRLVIYPSRSPEAIVIENVINVNRVELKVQELLSALSVDINDLAGPYHDE